jgi:ankyrin repeat protein
MRRIVILGFALFAILISPLRASAIPNEQINKQLLAACRDGDLSLSRVLLTRGANVNARVDGTTPLINAAMSGNVGLIRFLAAKGANVNAHDSDMGMTPLMWAAFDGNVPATALLLRLGADREATDKQGQTALFKAADHPKAFKYLLDHGANIHIADNSGIQPIHDAVMSARIECVQWLIARGADVNARDHDGVTPIALVDPRTATADMVKLLVEHHANLELRASNGTPVWMDNFFFPIRVKAMLEHGANANDRDGEGRTALMNAATQSATDVVRLLITHGANVNARGPHGETAYSLAAKREDYDRDDIIAVLIAAGEKDARIIPRKPDIMISPASDEYAVIATILRKVGTGSSYTVFVQDTTKGKDAAVSAGIPEVPLEQNIASLSKKLPNDLVRAFLTSTAPSEVVPSDTEIPGIRFIRDADLGTVFKDGGSWPAFYKKYPNSNGYMKVSLPVFDDKHQRALIYIVGAADGLAGSGDLYLYKKTDQGWREVKRVQLWVSEPVSLNSRAE